MTSPSWPVRTSEPLPGMLVVSMSVRNSVSSPTGGGEGEERTQDPPIPRTLVRQPSRHAHQALAIHHLGLILLDAQNPHQVLPANLGSITPLLYVPRPSLSSLLGAILRFGVIDGFGTTDGSELSFEGADAGFARVRGNEVEEGVVVHREERGGKDVRFELLGDEVLTGDVEFLVVL